MKRCDGSFAVRSLRAAGLALAGSMLACGAARADYVVGGSVHDLAGNGLVLHLTTNAGCLADDATFVLQSTDTTDCFTPQNVGKCCSHSIKATAFDGVSRVVCTCGVIIVGDASMRSSAVDATQAVAIAPNASSFAFPTPVPDIAFYSISVQSQPSGPTQRCTITRPSGLVNGQNVGSASVQCADGIFANAFDPR